ncbi:interaptin-like [Durio zibethinus]|uniref:Interaptin-like n=1 Tax=Durio zibethinus TaxID=66656 RepID=A0A6P5WYD3_DURZI|nr:interaptin-like [Durio zibethinus]XP_022721092.1 interaptin-like [Durio zibethinus]XP_022721098.1 interaptin-like [Durio zibethinus]XP_022721104.1 interaptin-like [Durio zibethinus]XP_022721111.1 interaptin-like [Durio zibethinus]
MTKHRFRESIKSFFGDHVDPEKEEQLKGNKIEIDDNVTKMLKLIKDEEVEESDGISIANPNKEPLVQLIEDFHKHYQNLYAQYDHLTGELRKKVHGKQEKDASSSSSSDSDSDYSSKDGGSKNRQPESEFQKKAEGIKQELEAANLEVANLKRKLTATSEEKDVLNSEYLASLSKVQEADEIIRNLKLESERSKSEKSELAVQNEELRHKLDIACKIEAEVNQRLEDLNRENNNLILEKETAVKRIEDGEKFTEDLRREVDWMKEENITLKQELERFREKVSSMQQQLESAEQQVSELSHSLNATGEENKSLTSKISEVSNEIQQAQGIIQQLMAEMSRAKEELGEKERELLTLTELHEVRGNHSSAQIKELEAQVTSLELELELLRATNRDMEVQMENKASEAKQLGEQNIGQQSQISELEMMSKKKEEELLTLTKKFEDNEKESLSRVENLTVQINNLLVNEEFLSTQKAQLEEYIVFRSDEVLTQVKSLMDQINTLQQELEALHSQKAELEVQLDRKTQAISDYVIEIEKAKEEAVSKTEDHQRVLQEKEGLLAQTKDLEFEVNSLKNQKGELEGELRTKIKENNQLREEKVGLQGQIFELEKTLAERELEFTALQEKHASAENETSSQLTALLVQVNNFLQELNSLQTQRDELELQLEKEKQESSERLTEMENQKSKLETQINNHQKMLEEQRQAYKKLAEEYKQFEGLYQECKANLEVAERKMEEMSEEFHRNIESKSQMAADLKQMVEDLQKDLEAKGDEKNDFINQITDHQRMLKEQEDAFNKLSDEYKQLETSFQDCKAIIEVTERKMQEMAGEHNEKVQSKDQIVADLEQIVEDLKRDLEMKGDELSTLVENVHTIEVKLRLSNQKLRVTEQLLTENEDSFRKAEAKFLEEQRMLEESIATLSATVAANNEAHCRMINAISENVNCTLTGFEAVIQKFEEGYRNYEHCVEETSKELRIGKNWVEEAKSEKKRLVNEVSNLIEQLKDQKEQESMLRERVEKLQIKANKEQGEKENLLKAVKHLEKKVELLESVMKDKDQGILGLGEEKREAIRQLCVWIDYHRGRCDDLKEILSKTVIVQRAT